MIEKATLRSMAEAGYQAEFKRARLDGEREGRLEGKREVAFKAAKACSREKMTLDLVAKYTGLPLDQIQALAAEINAEKSD
jgi:predicted transposase YdaD